jgi:hypothetical protein
MKYLSIYHKINNTFIFNINGITNVQNKNVMLLKIHNTYNMYD